MTNKFSRLVSVHSPKSTRAAKYNSTIRPVLVKFAEKHSVKFIEIPIVDLPYFMTRDIIERGLMDGDLIVAAGGDGIVNVTLDAAMSSQKDLILAAIPLGNVNDFTSVINSGITDPVTILDSKVVDFHPLDLSVNGEHELYSGQYISFGATTVLVDWLNSPEIRAARKKYRGNVARLMVLGGRNMGIISKNIATLKIPSFRHEGKTVHKNSVGFFLGRTGKFFRPQNGRKFHKSSDEFWFHTDNFHGKTTRDTMKLTRWLLRGIPGKISTHEKLEFTAPTNLVCQVGGDNVLLENVSEVTCQRAKKPIKILAPKK